MWFRSRAFEPGMGPVLQPARRLLCQTAGKYPRGQHLRRKAITAREPTTIRSDEENIGASQHSPNRCLPRLAFSDRLRGTHEFRQPPGCNSARPEWSLVGAIHTRHLETVG